MQDFGKILIIFGIVLVVIGLLWSVNGRFLPFGRLPGDIAIERENYKFYFPLGTSILISIILTLLLSLFLRK